MKINIVFIFLILPLITHAQKTYTVLKVKGVVYENNNILLKKGDTLKSDKNLFFTKTDAFIKVFCDKCKGNKTKFLTALPRNKENSSPSFFHEKYIGTKGDITVNLDNAKIISYKILIIDSLSIPIKTKKPLTSDINLGLIDINAENKEFEVFNIRYKQDFITISNGILEKNHSKKLKDFYHFNLFHYNVQTRDYTQFKTIDIIFLKKDYIVNKVKSKLPSNVKLSKTDIDDLIIQYIDFNYPNYNYKL